MLVTIAACGFLTLIQAAVFYLSIDLILTRIHCKIQVLRPLAAHGFPHLPWAAFFDNLHLFFDREALLL